MADKVITWTSPGPCTCCGGTPPAECACALLIPIGYPPTPYADYATAAAVTGQANATEWATCFAYFKDESATGTITALTSDATTANQLDITASIDDTPGIVYLWAAIAVAAGTDLDFVYTGTILTTPMGYTFNVTIFDCATGAEVDSDTVATQNGTATITGLAEGIYVVRFSYATLAFPPLSATLSVSIQATAGALTALPVIALWDDSGTTRQLEACPKFLMPLLTEVSGDWYADETAAQDVLDDPLQVASCVVFTPDTNVTSLSATDGGSSLTFQQDHVGGSTPVIWFSVNLEAGESLIFTRSGGGDSSVTVYDYEGNSVASGGGTTNPLSIGPVPYTGRYIVAAQVGDTGESPGPSVVVTSSGTLTVNPIQALYDVSLDCPARLDCS